MTKLNSFVRVCLYLFATGVFSINSAYAHYPHDIHSFVELSPDYVNDSTAFIASKQASSTRPVTALVSRDAGATWSFNAEGMDNIGKITSATASPLFDTDKTVILTSEGQGVYRSVDGGISWHRFNQGLNVFNLHDSLAAVDGQGNVTYFITATGGGMYQWSQQQTAWTQKLDSLIVVTAFAVSPDFASDQTLLAGDQLGKMYLSVDAGETFSPVELLTGKGMISHIEFAPDYASSGELFIGTSAGLYTSTDFLATVSAVESFAADWISSLALSPNYRADATMFATTPTQGIYKSTDRGTSWLLNETGVELVAQTSYHFHELKISDNFSNDGTVFLATFEGLFRSNDFGESWVELETRPPTLIMSVSMSPDYAVDKLMLVSTYGGGLYVTEDAGVNWRVSSNGVSSPYTYQVAIRKSNGVDPILLATNENHLLISEDKGLSWVEKEIFNVLPKVCIASIMSVSPDYANDQTVYLGCRKDGIVKTSDAGESWSLVLNSTLLNGGAITSIAISPNYSVDNMLMFSEHRGFFGKSLDEGLSWQLAQNGLPVPGRWYGGRGIVFSPDYKNDYSVAAATEKGLFATGNSQMIWSAIPDTGSPVAQGVIENIAISPGYAIDRTALTSVRGQGLFRTLDGGLSWQQVAAESTGNSYDIQGIVFSPDFANDGMVIGYGHDHMLRSANHGDSFEAFDIPFVRHEDNRKQSVLYSGNWIKISNDEASGTTFNASATPGNEVSLTFEGTGVRLVGVLANILGIAEVYLDDVLVATVDQYSDVPVWLHTLYEVNDLPKGTHKIRVVTTGEQNPASLANWVIVDAFDVIR